MSPAQRAQLSEWMRVYSAMTTNLDRNIGRLLQAIDDLGLRDNTIFVFTSDHGDEMFGAQGRRAKNIFYEEAGYACHFWSDGQDQIPEGHISDACLNTPDIMPTLLSMLNLPIPADVEGTDLSKAAFNQLTDEPDAAFMQGMGCVLPSGERRL